MERLWPFKPRPKHALPPPWHQRKLVWAGITIAAGIGVLLIAHTSAGPDDPFVEPDFNTTSSSTTSTTAPPACIDVANPSLLVTIAAASASAIAVDDGWFVAKANGATWLTTADPTRDAEGELLPMNDQARTDSASRSDVRDGDPMYGGHTNDEPEAAAARACAA